jgi:hypothetical protein
MMARVATEGKEAGSGRTGRAPTAGPGCAPSSNAVFSGVFSVRPPGGVGTRIQ